MRSDVADLSDDDVVRESRVIVTETRDTTGFDAVEVTGSGEVSIYGSSSVDPA